MFDCYKSWVDALKKRVLLKVKDSVISGLKEGKLHEKVNLSRSSKNISMKLDCPHIAFICSMMPPNIILAGVDIKENHTEEDFTDKDERFDLGWIKTGEEYHDWKKGFIPAEIVEVSNNLTIKRIRQDAIFGPPALKKEVVNEIITSSFLFPVKDKIVNFDSMEEVVQLLKDVKLNGTESGGACPEPYGNWGDKSSDEHFSRLFFHGIGALLLEQQTKASSRPELGPIEIDMGFMEGLSIRPGFRPYGAVVYFDLDQKCTGIYDSAKKKLFVPEDEGWEGAKFITRSSVFLLCTAREHLMQSHMALSNYFSLSSIKHLPPSHPIRRLGNVFTYRTNYVNDSAFSSLVPEGSILHHGTALEYEGLQAVFENSFQNSNAFEPFPKVYMRPELLEMSKNGKLPYHKEGVEFYNVVEKFVTDWLRMESDAATDKYAQAFYNEIRESTMNQKYVLPKWRGVKNMIDLLSQCIFRVTCYHEIAGVVVQYVNDPFTYALRLQEDKDGKIVLQSDVQSFLLTMAIVASTGLPVPMLMAPYAKYFGENGAPGWEKKIWGDFQDALKKQSAAVKKAESERNVEFLFFDPEKFESAISV